MLQWRVFTGFPWVGEEYLCAGTANVPWEKGSEEWCSCVCPTLLLMKWVCAEWVLNLDLKQKLWTSGTSHLCTGTAQNYFQLLEGTQIQMDRISCVKNGMFLLQDSDQEIFHRPTPPR